MLSDLWYKAKVSLGAKRDSHQEVSPVALIITRYPMTVHTRNEKGRQFASTSSYHRSPDSHESSYPLDK